MTRYLKHSILLLVCLLSLQGVAQAFVIDRNKPFYRTNFQLVGNLIVVKISINGSKKMNFILDSGASYTIITNLETIEELRLRRGEEITLRGLGKGFESKAYYSHDNSIELGRVKTDKASIILLYNNDLKLSDRLGITIHGIIGYDFFKHFSLDIDYRKERIIFYEPNYFSANTKKRAKGFYQQPIEIRNRKAFVQVDGVLADGAKRRLELLVDTGSWNALWLFSTKDDQIFLPEQRIPDFLGFGLSGPINGHRARIQELSLANVRFPAPTTSFPDSVALQSISKTGRNGSLGGEILRRFRVIFDFPERRIFLKPNRDVNDAFYYNMAGIELDQPYKGVPVYSIYFVRPGSPAALAGLKKGDIVQRINSIKPHEISLNEIFKLFRKREGTRIDIEFTRDNQEIKYASFRLKKLI